MLHCEIIKSPDPLRTALTGSHVFLKRRPLPAASARALRHGQRRNSMAVGPPHSASGDPRRSPSRRDGHRQGRWLGLRRPPNEECKPTSPDVLHLVDLGGGVRGRRTMASCICKGRLGPTSIGSSSPCTLHRHHARRDVYNLLRRQWPATPLAGLARCMWTRCTRSRSSSARSSPASTITASSASSTTTRPTRRRSPSRSRSLPTASCQSAAATRRAAAAI